VRDLGAVAELAFPLFGRGVSVSHSYAHLVDFGGEVEICGLRIEAGDLLYADRHGVIQIPLEIAAEIPAEAARQWRKERAIIELCRSPEFSLRGFGRKFSKFFDDLLTRGM
jgi:regulator of RNase E activity RraA